jgi:hypothetical protein
VEIGSARIASGSRRRNALFAFTSVWTAVYRADRFDLDTGVFYI